MNTHTHKCRHMHGFLNDMKNTYTHAHLREYTYMPTYLHGEKMETHSGTSITESRGKALHPVYEVHSIMLSILLFLKILFTDPACMFHSLLWSLEWDVVCSPEEVFGVVLQSSLHLLLFQRSRADHAFIWSLLTCLQVECSCCLGN